MLHANLGLFSLDCSEILGLGSSGDSDRDRLIKTGEMTPFGTVVKQEKDSTIQQTSKPPDTGARSEVTADSMPESTADSDKISENTDARGLKTSPECMNGENRNGFDDDDLYDAEMEEPGDHGNKDEEWLPSDQEMRSQSDTEYPVDAKEERKGNLLTKSFML